MTAKNYLVRHHHSYFKVVIIWELINLHVFNYPTNAYLILNAEQLILKNYYSCNALIQFLKALVYQLRQNFKIVSGMLN